jgi:hypothetical protein
MGVALIKSVRRGIFFDRKYWARYSKTGDGFKPVHFSSIIMDKEAPKLGKRVSKLAFEFPRELRVASVKVH